MRRFRPVVLLSLVSVAAPAQPVGTEFRVNTYTTGTQQNLSVAGMPTGFLVVWNGVIPGGAGQDVIAQRFDVNGAPVAAEFRVNVTTASSQAAPDVANHANTGFVVVYENGLATTFQRFLANGSPAGTGDVSNSLGTFPAVAAENSGDFVAVWRNADPDGTGVFARRVDSTNALVGAEFRVNTFTTSTQSYADVAMNDAGDFIVVWSGVGATDSSGVFLQRFSGTTGLPAGPEVRVNTFTTGNQDEPRAAARTDGPFLVIWSNKGAGNISGQRFGANGAPIGGEFQVNSVVGGARANPNVAFEANGDFLVTWLVLGAGGELFGRFFEANGSPVATEFRINTVTTGSQFDAVVASLLTDRFVVAWRSDALTGSGYDIVAQRFNRSGDVNGDGAVNVSDVLYLINDLFAGGPFGVGGIGDVNRDGQVNVSDILYLINFLFAGGPAPV